MICYIIDRDYFGIIALVVFTTYILLAYLYDDELVKIKGKAGICIQILFFICMLVSLIYIFGRRCFLQNPFPIKDALIEIILSNILVHIYALICIER